MGHLSGADCDMRLEADQWLLSQLSRGQSARAGLRSERRGVTALRGRLHLSLVDHGAGRVGWARAVAEECQRRARKCGPCPTSEIVLLVGRASHVEGETSRGLCRGPVKSDGGGVIPSGIICG